MTDTNFKYEKDSNIESSDLGMSAEGMLAMQGIETEESYVDSKTNLDQDKATIALLEADDHLPYIKYMGIASEAAAQETMGADSINLNDVKTNYETYDVLGPNGIASVKSSLSENHEYRMKRYSQYFNHQLGYDGRAYENGLSPIEQDAEQLIDLRNQGVCTVPDTIQSMNRDQVVDYLNYESLLMIPDDDVEPFRVYLSGLAEQNPGAYGLSEAPSSQELDHLRSRIRGFGIDTNTLQEMVNQKTLNDKT